MLIVGYTMTAKTIMFLLRDQIAIIIIILLSIYLFASATVSVYELVYIGIYYQYTCKYLISPFYNLYQT